MTKELAVVRGIQFGVRDCGQPCIYFSMEGLHYSALWLVRGQKNIWDFVNKSQCYKLQDLEGKPCVVLAGNMEMKFVRMLSWPREDESDE